ncbi:efflux transporter outer membrane subunit [Gilvimarinus algae]|uniref:Efflux transporter outer membrane subunit n=1 Tax=Gilvimarinus algae TaxID=3058037 RepID=A0ABT8TJW2_9GAMM|nr:efflux transporter outer membrane subunit [Gilvimarinus sp. SDUM040014]MDO3383383.1 efflux transporter outer membrane subunit [Gilvimarinus sp. SDUM040014]
MKLTMTTLAAALVLAGCANYRSVEEASLQAELPELADEFENADFYASATPVAHWWQQLGDAELSALVERSLTVNHDMRIARERLAESRALLRHTKLDRFPQVTASAQGERRKMSEQAEPGVGITEYYQAGFDARWELDLFGRVNNAVKAADAQLDEQQAIVRATQVSIAAEVGSAYMALRGAQHQLMVATSNAANLRETFELTRRLAEIGRADQFDITRASTQLALVEARLPSLEAQINSATNRLAVLTDQPEKHIRDRLAEYAPLPARPPQIAAGKPSELLRRRPDIHAAEARLSAATARYNVQVADLYPRITLNGGLGYLATDVDELGEQNSETFNFTPRIEWAAFDLGRVYARIDAADARARAQLAAFEQSVLLALEETDNALENYRRQNQRHEQLRKASVSSEQALGYARQRFEVGSENFLGVLDAERQRLTVSAQLAESETQLLQSLIAVYKSLAGGWPLPPDAIAADALASAR